MITIVGNVASGKSSAAPLIVKALGAQFLDADDIFQTENPFRERYLQDTPRWAMANELWMVRRRAEMLREAKEQMNGKPLVIDSGLLMSWVYAYSHYVVGNFSKEEWELYESLYEHMTLGLLDEMRVVMLKYSIPTLMKRLQGRGRDYELEFYTERYLKQLDEGLTALGGMLEDKKIGRVEVREEEVADFVLIPKDKRRLVSLVRDNVKWLI